MTWGEKTTSLEAILKNFWQDVPSIVDVPKSEDPNFDLTVESSKEYKAINDKGVWLVMNPALMKIQADRRVTTVLRKKPKFLMSLSDAKKDENKFRFKGAVSADEDHGGLNL